MAEESTEAKPVEVEDWFVVFEGDIHLPMTVRPDTKIENRVNALELTFAGGPVVSINAKKVLYVQKVKRTEAPALPSILADHINGFPETPEFSPYGM